MSFPSFDADAMRVALPEQYFGVRPPTKPGQASPRASRAVDINDLPRGRGPTWSGRNGDVLRRQAGYGKGHKTYGSSTRVFRGTPGVLGDSGEDLEYEYHRSPVARPRELGGGPENIKSEVIVRRELRALTKVKNSIPTDAESVLHGQVATLQDFFSEFEPLPDSSRGSKYTVKQIKGMLKRTPDFGKLCHRLGELYPMSPLQFATEDLVEHALQASRQARQEVEDTMASLRTQGRVWPGGEINAAFGGGTAPEKPDVNPRVGRGIVTLGAGFAITEAPMKNLKGAMAAKVEGTLTPADREMTARVEDALVGVKRSYFPHSRQGRLRESEQPRAAHFRVNSAVHGGSVITGGQNLGYRARRQVELENEAAAYSSVVLTPKVLLKMTGMLQQVTDQYTGQQKKAISESDWHHVMDQCELPLDGDDDFASRLFAHFVRLTKDIVRDNTFKNDRLMLFVSTVPVLQALKEPELRKLKDMVHEIEVMEDEIVDGLVEKKQLGSEAVYFVDEGEVQVELKGEVVAQYTAGQWFGEEALVAGPDFATQHTYRAVGCVESHSEMPGAVATRGAILFKISAHDIDLIPSNKLQRLRSITQAPFIRALKNSVSVRFPRGQMLVRKKMNCVVRRLASYSKSVGNLDDGEIFEILEEVTDKEGTYHVRMKRNKGSASGSPIEGWVTATSFAMLNGEDRPKEIVVDVDVIISCMTMLINGTAKDKIRMYFALYLSEDTSAEALGSVRCVDRTALPRFFDTIANHYSVPAAVLEQLARDAGTVINGGPASDDLTGAHHRSADTSTSSLSGGPYIMWEWLWHACELTKDLNDMVARPRLSLRYVTEERGSERVEAAGRLYADLQAQHAVSLSSTGQMFAGNISPRSSHPQRQKKAWKERSRSRSVEERRRTLASPSRMSGTNRSLASPNSSYGPMATWELLDEDTELREERLAKEMADAAEDSGYLPGHSNIENYVETIGPPIGLDKYGRRSLTSYKQTKMAHKSKTVSSYDLGPSAEDSMRDAVKAWHSMEALY